jgi:hypothetical protein
MIKIQSMPTEDLSKLLQEIQPYMEAFFKQQAKGGKITQKDLSVNGIARPADISAVFRYLRRDSKEMPIKSAIIRLHRCLMEHWILEAGVLKLATYTKPVAIVQKEEVWTNSVVVPHDNFEKAKSSIMEAVNKTPKGGVVCVLNTYLSSTIFHNELDDGNEGTINNWLLAKGKSMRLLLLRPDGKAMRLRTNTDLEMTGDNLAISIIGNLRSLLRLQNRCKTRSGSGQLEIKVMDEIPGMSCIITPWRIFQGIHYSFGHSEKGTVFEVKGNENTAYRDFKKHFDTFWNDKERSQVLTPELLDQIEKGVNITLQNNKLNHLLGNWNVHVHDLKEVYLGNSTAPQGQVTGGVTTLFLEIEKPNRGLYLKARLKVPGREGYLGGSVNVITEHLLDRDYAHMRFTDLSELSIHITIHCNQDKNNAPLFGHFIISSQSDTCSGPIIFQKVKHFEAEIIVLPFIKRQLAFIDGGFSSLELINKRMESFRAPFPYAGTYKVYSYGENNGKKCIKINVLEIDEWGQARYKNQNFKEEPIIGRATHIGTNLHLVFSKYKPQKRRNYWIISVKEALPEPERFYSAVHLGVSWITHLPTGKRYVLEYTQESFNVLKPYIVSLHTPEYHELPSPLRKLMSGRTDNLLGFLRQRGDIFSIKDIEREWQRSVIWSEVFVDSAHQLIQRGYIKSAAQMLIRAINHGFEELEHFEDTVKQQFGEEILLKFKKQEEYKRVLRLLPPDNILSPII